MLNYVAGLLLTYLIFDSASYWRDTSTLQARAFPQGKPMPKARNWPTFGSTVVSRSVLLIGLGAALALWVLYSRTRFGFEVASSPTPLGRRDTRACGRGGRSSPSWPCRERSRGSAARARSATSPTRSTGARPGLQAAAFGYTGIVVAALARYNPFAVCLVAVLIGGLQNAGFTLQGADFPSGLVGVMQGIILFCALGGELLIRYRPASRAPRERTRRRLAGGRNRDNDSLLVIVLAQAVLYGTPLLYASLGELLAERSGVAEPRRRGDDAFRRSGRVLGDAARRRLAASCSRSRPRGAALAGAAMAAIHAFLTITLRASQIVSGLALTIFAGGLGLSAYFGNELGLADLPATHQFASLDVLGLRRPVRSSDRSCSTSRRSSTRPGLLDAARRRSTWAARASGSTFVPSARRRLPRTRWESTSRSTATSHVLVGGAFAGVGGACYSLSITAGLDGRATRSSAVPAGSRSRS